MFTAPGGPEVLELVEEQIRPPGPGQVVVRHEAIGVNFVDIYQRNGLYPVHMPSGLGIEASGRVEAVGPDVDDVTEGEAVAYCSTDPGSYADRAVVDCGKLVKLPPEISFEVAAGVLVKGLTARMLVKSVHKVAPGDRILLHAAAGGVGLIATRWAKHLGAFVIGVVGTAEKAERARANGCDEVIISSQEDVATRVHEFTAGAGCNVVYDSVGKATFTSSLDSLGPLGLFVSFGNASGPPPPIDLGELMRRGSLFATRPTFATYVRTPELLGDSSDDLFFMLRNGLIGASVDQIYALQDVAEAHRALESRRTEGSTVLIP